MNLIPKTDKEIRDMAMAIKDLSNCVNGGVVNPTTSPLG